METRKLSVKVEGLAPGYMQSKVDIEQFKPETKKTGGGKGARASPKTVDQTVEAMIYFNDQKQACIPAEHIRGCLINAAKDFVVSGKRGKTYKELFVSSVFVYPTLVPINPGTWEKDFSTGVNQSTRGRIPLVRPRFNAGWQAEFELEIQDDTLTDETVKLILEHGGTKKGIGVYRPTSGGPYGRFLVRQFEATEPLGEQALADP